MRRSLVLIALLLAVVTGVYAALESYASELVQLARDVVLYDPERVRFSLVEDLTVEFATSTQIGADGRIYVADEKGSIWAFEVERGPRNSFRAVSSERIGVIAEIPNHQDDGSLNPDVVGRLITGLLATGTPESPEFFVSSSDPRVNGTDLDTNSGMISLVRKDGDRWLRDDLVCGLPRSRTDHATNGLHFDEDNQVLYVMQGGNTNQGAPAEHSGNLMEYALSAALLRIDLNRINGGCFNLPTLDDPGRPHAEDENDPFGGADGMNQAILDPTGPVTIYATGFRNPYRLVPFRDGFLTIDNGPNQFQGGPPAWRGDQVTNDPSPSPGELLYGPLLRVRQGSHHGHPNPTRADKRNSFAGQSPVPKSHPKEAAFIDPADRQGALALFHRSVNGLAWYPEDVGPADWRGRLVVVGWDRLLRLLDFDEEGWISDSQVIVEQAASTPLDIAISPAGSLFEGTIWICDYVSGRVAVITPGSEQASFLDSIAAAGRGVIAALRTVIFSYYDVAPPPPTMEILRPT